MSLDTVQIAVNECFKCKHKVEDHKDGFCNGSIGCMCSQFILPALANFMAEIQKVKETHKSIQERCKFILEKIPRLRNAGEKSFVKAYWWIWHDFKIKEGTKIEKHTWRTIPVADTINREKRRVKEHNEQLKSEEHT